jgi:hypothetical protein
MITRRSLLNLLTGFIVAQYPPPIRWPPRPPRPEPRPQPRPQPPPRPNPPRDYYR